MSGEKKSIARSLGEFVGHVWRGVKTDVSAGDSYRKELRRDVEEETRETEEGRVTLRRTVIEEVEMDRPGEGEPGTGR